MSAQRTTAGALGVDFGRTRLRVALTTIDRSGKPRLTAVATRDIGSDPSSALREAVAELSTPQRACVIGISHPDAILRTINLPRMSPAERYRAATFQAARFIDYPVEQAAVSLVPLDGQRWALGIVRRTVLDARLALARRARLRAIAVDDIAFALGRVHRDADGAIDISDETTRLILFGKPVPYVASVAIGGMTLTEGIARSLGIDATMAEERKRSIGFGGAGEAQRDALTDAIGDMLAAARAAGYTAIRALTLLGNGSRVPGLAEAIERRCGYGVRAAEIPADASETLPSDVLRAAGADWSVAFGLSLWNVAS